MNFLEPAAFWFALALPVVVVFYLLKRKRVVKLISSTLLWQKFLAENQANAPFQKLRKNWLLFLQLLMLILVILALARPYFAAETKPTRLRVLVLDASASMQATDVKPSRAEEARAEALKFVDGLRDNESMIVLQVGAITEVKQSKTSEKAALRRAINDYKPTDSITRLDEALRLAETLIKNEQDPEIHLFSDGAFPFPEGFETKPLPLVYHRIGVSSDNAGITAMDVRANPDNAAQRAIFASVSNASSNVISGRLELSFNGQTMDVKAIEMKPKENVGKVFVVDQKTNGVFTLNLVVNDDLAIDNQASVISLLPQPIKVLLASSGNRFLEKAVKAAPNVQLSTTSDLRLSGGDYDVVVVDNVAPIEWPTANVLAINTWRTNWFGAIGKLEQPAIVDWKNTHPLLRFVNMQNVAINESLAVKAPPWALPLVESPQSPLVLAGELNNQRIVWVGFDTLASTWPLRVSFPIFIANAIDWLNPATSRAELLSVQAGMPFHFRFENPVSSATVTRPDGQETELVINTNTTEVLYGDTTKRGLYKLKTPDGETDFTVNLLDSGETDITPRDELPFGKNGRTIATTVQQANLEIWRWIALAGLVLLMFEWWFYHKRTA
ncbi:VWA domain-containing protein [bacterium]|nr:VWA domain-containing protein [bacterium]